MVQSGDWFNLLIGSKFDGQKCGTIKRIWLYGMSFIQRLSELTLCPEVDNATLISNFLEPVHIQRSDPRLRDLPPCQVASHAIDGKWENYAIQNLTNFCPANFFSISADKNVGKRTKIGSLGQKLDLMRTKLGFWRQILVFYGTRTFIGHIGDIQRTYVGHGTKSGQK